MSRLAGVVGLCAMAVAGALPLRAVSQDAVAKPAAPETFRLELDGDAQKMPSWILLVQSDGTGLYWPTLTAKYGQVPVHLSEETWKRVHAGVAAIEEKRCETKLKNIAKTGVKDVEYQGGATGTPDATCTFNYSDDAGLNDAVVALQAMAETMQYGDRLAHERRFDRLSLDAEMESLESEVKAGRAIEVENIAAVLQSIAEDEHVIDRARRRATRLLVGAGVAVQ